MKVERSYFNLFELLALGVAYLEKKKDKEDVICESFIDFRKQYKAVQEEYDLEIAAIQRRNCMKATSGDKKGAILYDDIPLPGGGVDRRKCFNEEGEAAVAKEIHALLDKKITVHARIIDGEGITELIEALTTEEKAAFSEILIPKIVNE